MFWSSVTEYDENSGKYVTGVCGGFLKCQMSNTWMTPNRGQHQVYATYPQRTSHPHFKHFHKDILVHDRKRLFLDNYIIRNTINQYQRVVLTILFLNSYMIICIYITIIQQHVSIGQRKTINIKLFHNKCCLNFRQEVVNQIKKQEHSEIL